MVNFVTLKSLPTWLYKSIFLYQVFKVDTEFSEFSVKVDTEFSVNLANLIQDSLSTTLSATSVVLSASA